MGTGDEPACCAVGAVAAGAGAVLGDAGDGGLSGEPVGDGGRAATSAQLVSVARGWRACV